MITLHSDLCFIEARDAFEAGEISEAVFHASLLAHYAGARHQFDANPSRQRRYELVDLVVVSVYENAILKEYEAFSIDEYERCEMLFQACVNSDTEALRENLEALTNRHGLLVEPIAQIAASTGNARVFEEVLPIAIANNANIRGAIQEIVFKVPYLLDTIYEENWANVRQDLSQLTRSILTPSLLPWKGDRLAVLKWLIAHGATIADEEFKQMAWNPPVSEVLSYLLDRTETHRDDILTKGMLQHAVSRGRYDAVKVLLDGGADVNEKAPVPGPMGEPYLRRALYMATNPDEHEDGDPDMVRLLLERGADMNLPASISKEETALQAAQRKGDPRVLEIFDEFSRST